MNNLITRSLSGIVFLAVMIGGILLSEYSFAAIFLFVLVMGQWEFNRMTIGKNRHLLPKILSVVAGMTLFVTTFLCFRFHISQSWILLCTLPFYVSMISSLYEKDKSDYVTVAYAYTSMIYVALPMTLANIVVFAPEGAYNGTLLLCFFLLIWGSDVGAYCLGCLLGKNGKKMFPSISPKKSWWGFAGGIIFALAIALILHFTGVLNFGLVHSLVFALILNVSGVFGDLVESVWKRSYGIKDSGNLIPGHGGILDRFDSSFFAIPLGTGYLMMMGLI